MKGEGRTMTNITVESALDLIGETPMVKLKEISKDIPAEIWAKIEYLNPSGSIKDRIALKMIEEAERRGLINKDTTIVEPTSGNTGVALAMVCARKGYKMISVVPEAVSKERQLLVKLYGGTPEVVPCVCPEKGVTKDDMENVVKRAEELTREIPNAFMPDQFRNEDNTIAHVEGTAREILEQTGGRLQAFVAACGTGGTFSGVARVLREKYPEVIRVVLEPSGSAVMSGCPPGHHKIQGIGEGFVPEVMEVELAHRIMQVSDEDAICTAHRLWQEEGIMAGISSGANVFASLELGKNMKEGDIIVTLIPDNGLRYLSTADFVECE